MLHISFSNATTGDNIPDHFPLGFSSKRRYRRQHLSPGAHQTAQGRATTYTTAKQQVWFDSWFWHEPVRDLVWCQGFGYPACGGVFCVTGWGCATVGVVFFSRPFSIPSPCPQTAHYTRTEMNGMLRFSTRCSRMWHHVASL